MRFTESTAQPRRGSHRVLYDINDDKHLIKVTRIGHGADLYRPR
jgi:mRNA-degrading endonuclease RelE of RelBE toxin-antitoxin system